MKDKLKKYSKIRPSGCWEWQRSKTKGGYGCVWSSGLGKLLMAHQASFMEYHGEIPEGMVVRHSCNNPSCCNPEHLSLGTQHDNIQDAIKAGNIKPKLTEEMVREIRESTLSLRKAGKKYGVSSTTIHRIRGGDLYGYSYTVQQTKGD